MAAIKALTREGHVLTPDVGGSARTVEVGDEIVAQMRAAEKRASDS
jgi:isocitrate/isopropylmalate dehydrogenase